MSRTRIAQLNRRSAPLFAALGDPTRLQLVLRLSAGKEYSISQLGEGLALSRQGVTKHLRVLEQAGLIQSCWEGRENRYRYVPEAIAPAAAYLEQVEAHWDAALLRLQRFVESAL